MDAHDAEMTSLLIANPLAEYDLVGFRLIDRIAQTRVQLGALDPPTGAGAELIALGQAIDATSAMLKAVDPGGTATDQASAYVLALDDWVDHVRPHAESIRRALGLAPVPPGDLQL